MTTQWGAPLTGAQMRTLRAAGLPDATPVIGGRDEISRTAAQFSFNARSPYYYLPADLPAYKLLEKGCLDGRNVALWFGSDKAPDDWLECSDVLFRNGVVPLPSKKWTWAHRDHFGDIIAYIRKAENREETVRARQSFDDTVTIAKMTEAEWELRVNSYGMLFEDMRDIFCDLGLIKLEPTREERFTQETGIMVTPEIQKALDFK